MPIFSKSVSCNMKRWLVGGGIAALLTGAIAYGMDKMNLLMRLDKNDQDHSVIYNSIQNLNTGRETHAIGITKIGTKLDAISENQQDMRSDIRCIRAILEADTAGGAITHSK